MKRSQNWQKLIDRYVGIPLLALMAVLRSFSLFFRRRKPPAEPRTLGVLCVAALGDLLLLSASIKAFRQAQPSCRILLFCGPDNKSLVPLIDPEQSLFSEVHVLHPKKSLQNFFILKSKKCDVVIDAGQWARWSALMAFLLPSQWRIGFQTPGQHRHFLFDQPVSHQNSQHEIENFRSLFSNWVQAQDLAPAELSVSAKQEGSRDPYIVCHLFPSGASPFQKEWPRENWLALFRQFQAWGYKVCLTGGPADRARLEKEFTAEDLQGIDDQIGKLTLEKSRDLLSRATLVVSVNTGIMHMAAALNAPLIALHGPTDEKRWGPVSKTSVAIQSSLPCSPCLNLGFEYGCPRNDCMKKITPADVLLQAEKFLNSHS